MQGAPSYIICWSPGDASEIALAKKNLSCVYMRFNLWTNYYKKIKTTRYYFLQNNHKKFFFFSLSAQKFVFLYYLGWKTPFSKASKKFSEKRGEYLIKFSIEKIRVVDVVERIVRQKSDVNDTVQFSQLLNFRTLAQKCSAKNLFLKIWDHWFDKNMGPFFRKTYISTSLDTHTYVYVSRG